MSLPREPRQKMINMMYLVLTALLALNVSSEILNAFKTVNNSLETTNVTVDKSTSTILASLQDKKTRPETAERANIWAPKADAARNYSVEVYNYIQTLKDRILREADGDPNNPDKSFKEDNLDIATRIMVDKGEGKKLKSALEQYKTNVLAIDPKIKTEFENSLPINTTPPKGRSKATQTWEGAYFHMVPTVAALTILSKFQNDVKTTENKIVAYCHEQVGKVEVRNDAFAAIAVADANYVLPGQKINITAGIGGFSTAVKPEITIDGAPVEVNPAEGTAKKEITAGSLGPHSIRVHFEYTNQDGKKVPVDRTIEYTVGQASASIALDKMNVLYMGVDNPVTIAASGGGDDRVKPSINNGTLTKVGAGKYIARVSKADDNTIITVTVDGKVAGSSQFRVRNIPEAQAYVGGQPSGAQVSAGAFKAQGGVQAGIKNFPFQLDYEVVSYTFTCDSDDGIVSVPATGAAFTGAVRTAINNNVKADRMVTIENIRVKGPDGRVTTAPSLLYYIK
jgi:gliding motility-associated protein GldM